jgi:hypothetical protein
MRKALVFLFTVFAGYANASDHADHLHPLKLVNQANFSYMLWKVYDIALFDEDGQFDHIPPYALRLTYLRELSGTSIADRSSKLIRSQGVEDEIQIAGWHSQMDEIFPDVSAGDTLSGLYNENKETVFFYNGEAIGRIQDPLFGQYFFGIWLGEDTTEPRLRSQLIGSTDG